MSRVTSGYSTSADMDFTIDLANMGQSLNNWRMIESAFTRGTELGQEELARRLKDEVLFNLQIYGLGGTSIGSTVNVVRLGKGMSVTVGSEYAIYVEYGTGIVGARESHPNPMAQGWVYDVNNHGEKGWMYPTTADDPNPQKKMFNGQLYGWTRGMASRPFMYEAWRWAKASANSIIGKSIRAEVKKCRGVR